MSKDKKPSKQSVTVKLKKGDEVIVIAGKDKGKQGTINAVMRKGGKARVLVDGVNMVKKHVRPNPNKGEQGGIVPQEAYLDVSNVQIFNAATGKGDRIGYKVLDDGRKVRYFKSTDELIDSE